VTEAANGYRGAWGVTCAEDPFDALPPALMMVEPTVPLPPNVAPLFTLIRLECSIEPSTMSAPAFTVVGTSCAGSRTAFRVLEQTTAGVRPIQH
jgi:hypothetical protein